MATRFYHQPRAALSTSPVPQPLLRRQHTRPTGHGGISSADAVPPIAREAIQSPGQPLDAATRRDLEPRFGHDFSRVRLHTDAQAAQSARAVDALAYTIGTHIAFAPGQYQPASSAGQQLLAHELTHVVQQSRQGISFQRQSPTGEDDPLEHEAEEAGRGVGKRGPRSTLPYREAVRSLPAQNPAPPAALLPDKTQPVLDSDQPRFNELRSFVTTLPPRLRELVARGAEREPWLKADNPHIQAVLRVLDRLVADMATERFVVRFDAELDPEVGASYDYINDTMFLRPFSGQAERTSVAISLIHEYTHILQDRAAEAAFAQQRAPRIDTREEGVQHEIGARREQVYFGELLRALGLSRPISEAFGAQVSDMKFRGQFEQERTAATPDERAEASGQIRSEIEKAYKKQLERNSGYKTYAIELDRRNHALLHWDMPGRPTPLDLGALPQTLTQTAQLRSHLIRLLRALPELSALFTSADGQRFQVLEFFVVYRDRKVVEFGIKAP